MDVQQKKIKIAFIKFGGLSAGGTERWLQMMAANLPKDKFEIDYYYCDSAPYVGSDYQHADTDPDRLRYMEEHGINLIKFNVGAKDITTKTHDWRDTNFWEVFDERKYDLIQTAKAGPEEYPYYLIKKPIIEYVTLTAGVDYSPNIIWTIHLSNWQRRVWHRFGGSLRKSSIIPIPVSLPASNNNLRNELNIPTEAIVAGFHQRVDNNIFSELPLNAFAKMQNDNWHFVIMGGGGKYREQAHQLGLKNIHFLEHSGVNSDISKFLNTLDIFAHGRKDGETFGTVLAEAMIHGKPCISHYSQIANAQVETMGPGGLFAENENDYVEKLKQLFSNRQLREQLSINGYQFALKNYLLDFCVNKLSQLYQDLYKEYAKSDFEKVIRKNILRNLLLKIYRHRYYKNRKNEFFMIEKMLRILIRMIRIFS